MVVEKAGSISRAPRAFARSGAGPSRFSAIPSVLKMLAIRFVAASVVSTRSIAGFQSELAAKVPGTATALT